MNEVPSLSHTAARYLQAIKQLGQNDAEVRQITVANHLNVRPSSCFESVLRLIKRGLVAEDEHKFLHVTQLGHEALKTVERNQYVFTTFFRDVLGTCCQDAERIAAQIEPILDEDTAVRMCRFSRFLEHNKGQTFNFDEAWTAFEDNIATDPICQKCVHQDHCLKTKVED